MFYVTCARTGVGSITSIDLRTDGNDGWYVDWVHVSDGLESFTMTSQLAAFSTMRERQQDIFWREGHECYM